MAVAAGLDEIDLPAFHADAAQVVFVGATDPAISPIGAHALAAAYIQS